MYGPAQPGDPLRVDRVHVVASGARQLAFERRDNDGVRASGAINKSMTASAVIEVGVNGPNLSIGSGFDISGSGPANWHAHCPGVDFPQRSGYADDRLTAGAPAAAASSANFVGTGHVFGIWGPGGDKDVKASSWTAQGSIGNGVTPRRGSDIRVRAAREARIQYDTPNLMGVGLQGSYNQAPRADSAASMWPILPASRHDDREVSIALNAAYRLQRRKRRIEGLRRVGQRQATTRRACIVTPSMYGKQSDNTAWMVEGGWTGRAERDGQHVPDDRLRPVGRRGQRIHATTTSPSTRRSLRREPMSISACPTTPVTQRCKNAMAAMAAVAGTRSR